MVAWGCANVLVWRVSGTSIIMACKNQFLQQRFQRSQHYTFGPDLLSLPYTVMHLRCRGNPYNLWEMFWLCPYLCRVPDIMGVYSFGTLILALIRGHKLHALCYTVSSHYHLQLRPLHTHPTSYHQHWLAVVFYTVATDKKQWHNMHHWNTVTFLTWEFELLVYIIVLCWNCVLLV